MIPAIYNDIIYKGRDYSIVITMDNDITTVSYEAAMLVEGELIYFEITKLDNKRIRLFLSKDITKDLQADAKYRWDLKEVAGMTNQILEGSMTIKDVVTP